MCYFSYKSLVIHPEEKMDFLTSLLPKPFLSKRGLYSLAKCLVWTIGIINDSMNWNSIS